MSRKLLKIVKSLTKSNKRLFSNSLQNTKRKTLYLSIINHYSKADSYHKQLDEQIFGQQDQSFVNNCKNTFKSTLFQFLANQEKRRNPKGKVIQLINVAEMLIDRFLMEEALKTINKAEKFAVSNNLECQLIEILGIKLKINRYFFLRNREVDEALTEKVIANRKQALESYQKTCNSEHTSYLAGLDRLLSDGFQKVGTGETKLTGKAKNGNPQVSYNSTIKAFNEALAKSKYPEAVENLKMMIDFQESNIKSMPSEVHNRYIINLASLCNLYSLTNRGGKINEVVQKLSAYQPQTQLNHFTKTSLLIYSHCIHSLATTQPELAAKFLEQEDVKKFITEIDDRNPNLQIIVDRILMVHIANARWDKCLEFVASIYIKKLDQLRDERNNRLEISQMISVFESDDWHYLEKLVHQFSNKSRKGHFDLFDRGMLEIFKAILKRNCAAMIPNFELILEDFKNAYSDQRYFIYWLVNRFPVLQNEAYHNFLTRLNYPHYNSKTIASTPRMEAIQL